MQGGIQHASGQTVQTMHNDAQGDPQDVRDHPYTATNSETERQRAGGIMIHKLASQKVSHYFKTRGTDCVDQKT